MAESDVVYNPDQGASDTPSPFAPSLMSLASGMDKSELPQPTEYKPEDLEGIFSMPFDAASFITKVEDLELNKKELEQLCRIWAKPFGALSQKYPNFPWIMAGTLTMGIIVEKVIIYYIAMEARRKKQKKNLDLAHSQSAAKIEEIDRARQSNV